MSENESVSELWLFSFIKEDERLLLLTRFEPDHDLRGRVLLQDAGRHLAVADFHLHNLPVKLVCAWNHTLQSMKTYMFKSYTDVS